MITEKKETKKKQRKTKKNKNFFCFENYTQKIDSKKSL